MDIFGYSQDIIVGYVHRDIVAGYWTWIKEDIQDIQWINLADMNMDVMNEYTQG